MMFFLLCFIYPRVSYNVVVELYFPHDNHLFVLFANFVSQVI